ncbi:hypothetical protein D3C72_1852310 [compost metagenome]
MRSVAGSCRRMAMTSSARRSSVLTRQGIFLMGMSPAPCTSRHSMVMSEVALAQQNSARPSVFSCAVSAEAAWSPWTKLPSTTRPLQEPQAPFLQP